MHRAHCARQTLRQVPQTPGKQLIGVKTGAQIVSGSWDETIRLWDAREGRFIGEPFTGHTNVVSAVALGALKGRPVVVSGSHDRTIWVWDVRTREPISMLRGHAGPITSVGLGAVDGRAILVSGSKDHTIRLWDVESHQVRCTIDLGTELISIALDPDVGIITGLAEGAVDLEIREMSLPHPPMHQGRKHLAS